MTRSHCCLRLTRGQPCLGGSAAIACSTRRGSVGAVPLSQAPLLRTREVDSAGPNRQLVGLIRSRDPDGYPRPKHNRSPSGGAPCNPMQKNREVPLRKSLFRHSLPNRAPSTDFSLSATPFHFFSQGCSPHLTELGAHTVGGTACAHRSTAIWPCDSRRRKGAPFGALHMAPPPHAV